MIGAGGISVLLGCAGCGRTLTVPHDCSTATCPKCGAVTETETGLERKRLADEGKTETGGAE